MDINRGLKKLQDQFNENPMQTIAIGGIAAAGLSKLIKAINDVQKNRVWKQEVRRRRYNDMRRGSRVPYSRPRRRY